jgi:ribosome-binding protein aMBF1 (putative translation factor)
MIMILDHDEARDIVHQLKRIADALEKQGLNQALVNKLAAGIDENTAGIKDAEKGE